MVGIPWFDDLVERGAGGGAGGEDDQCGSHLGAIVFTSGDRDSRRVVLEVPESGVLVVGILDCAENDRAKKHT